MKVKDHTGQEFESWNKMCKFYNKNPSTVKSIMERYNWSLAKALTEPVIRGFIGYRYKFLSKINHQKWKYTDITDFMINGNFYPCTVYVISTRAGIHPPCENKIKRLEKFVRLFYTIMHKVLEYDKFWYNVEDIEIDINAADYTFEYRAVVDISSVSYGFQISYVVEYYNGDEINIIGKRRKPYNGMSL